jgi:hypothetical protein
MKDGSIILFTGGDDILSKAIRFFTGSPYTHTAVYVKGYTFDSTVWHDGRWWQLWKWHTGVRKTYGILPGAALVLSPMVPLSETEAIELLTRCNMSEEYHFPYNVLKLLVLAIVYPTRKFWEEKVKWIPFSGDFLGETCAEYVDEMYKPVRDWFPGKTEQDTVPGDWAKCPGLEVA